MNLVLEVLANTLVFLLRIIVEIPVMWVGEITLFLVTLGRHKPRWDVYTAEGGGDFAFLSERSFWIGAATICCIGVVLKIAFLGRP